MTALSPSGAQCEPTKTQSSNGALGAIPLSIQLATHLKALGCLLVFHLMEASFRVIPGLPILMFSGIWFVLRLMGHCLSLMVTKREEDSRSGFRTWNIHSAFQVHTRVIHCLTYFSWRCAVRLWGNPRLGNKEYSKAGTLLTTVE